MDLILVKNSNVWNAEVSFFSPKKLQIMYLCKHNLHKCWINYEWSWIHCFLFPLFDLFLSFLFPVIPSFTTCLLCSHILVLCFVPSALRRFLLFSHSKPSVLCSYWPCHTCCHSPQSLCPHPLECTQTYFSGDNVKVCNCWMSWLKQTHKRSVFNPLHAYI